MEKITIIIIRISNC